MAFPYVTPYPVYPSRLASPYGPFGTPAADWVAIRWGRSRGVLAFIFELLRIAPETGPAAGGTAVVLTGQGFRTGATVTIGGVAATSVVVVNSTTITAVTGAHAPGAVDVVVTLPDGRTDTLVGGFTYT